MGFLEKVKNMFIEEIEEEEPIKKEVIQVKIPKPVLDEEKEEEKIKITKYDDEEEESIEKEEEEAVITVKPEKKPFVPTYFDDEDFKDLKKDDEEEIIKPKKEEPIRHEYGQKKYEQTNIVKPNISGYNGKKEEPVKKVFQPSPVISPVYGVLDKNYKKEEITSKKKTPLTSNVYTDQNVVSVDDIRKKAFGTLEDDLEKTLIDKDAIMFTGPSNKKKVKEEPKKEEVKEEPKKTKKEKKEEVKEEVKEDIDIFAVLDEDSDMNELDKLLNSYDFDMEEPKIEDELNKDYDKMEKELKLSEKLENSDLFNLIDEMYEKKDGE